MGVKYQRVQGVDYSALPKALANPDSPEYKTFYFETSAAPGAGTFSSTPATQITWQPTTDIMIQKISFAVEMATGAGLRSRLNGSFVIQTAGGTLNADLPPGVIQPPPAGYAYVNTQYRWVFDADDIMRDLENCEALLSNGVALTLFVDAIASGAAFAGGEAVFWFVTIYYKEV